MHKFLRVALGSLNADAPNGVDSGSVLLATFCVTSAPFLSVIVADFTFLAFVIISLSSHISGVADITFYLVHLFFGRQLNASRGCFRIRVCSAAKLITSPVQRVWS